MLEISEILRRDMAASSSCVGPPSPVSVSSAQGGTEAHIYDIGYMCISLRKGNIMFLFHILHIKKKIQKVEKRVFFNVPDMGSFNNRHVTGISDTAVIFKIIFSARFMFEVAVHTHIISCF